MKLESAPKALPTINIGKGNWRPFARRPCGDDVWMLPPAVSRSPHHFLSPRLDEVHAGAGDSNPA